MLIRFLSVFLVLAGLCTACAAGVNGREDVRIGERILAVYTYRPADCAPAGVLLVFHGMSRNADSYRDHAAGFADRHCLTVFAPRFDAERFSIWDYHGGGITSPEGLRPPAEWTVHMADDLVAWVRRHDGLAAAPVYLFGHSAGAQFLSRAAAFAALPGVMRIVIANPSTHVLAALDEPVPFGFAGLSDDAAKRHLAAYLKQPVTIYLGSDDTGQENLYDAPEARRQGEHRLARGRTAYRTALAAAGRTGLPCNWTIVEAAGVGHSARAMLDAPEATTAFGLAAAP
ncbi:MAG: alpha/beta hydrolase [Kiloniellaceae bacterium]